MLFLNTFKKNDPFATNALAKIGGEGIRVEMLKLFGDKAGQRLRASRSTEIEPVFGIIKQNMGFRRFHLRGLEKVKIEWGLVSIAHNMKKLAAI